MATIFGHKRSHGPDRGEWQPLPKRVKGVDRRKELHSNVLSTIQLPTKQIGQFIVAVHDVMKAGEDERVEDFKIFEVDATHTIEHLTNLYLERTEKQCIFNDGRDYFKITTQLKALDYFQDGVIVLEAYIDLGRKHRPQKLIHHTVSEGGVATFPLNEKELDYRAFKSTAPLSSAIERLTKKYPEDRFDITEEDGVRHFVCHDCKPKSFRPNISVKSMAEHLEDEFHQALVEARFIRESAVPGAVKHKRMLIFHLWFQDLLSEMYLEFPIDLLLPGVTHEYECESDCSHSNKWFEETKPVGYNIRCLECPMDRDGDLKEWDLEELEDSEGREDKEWLKFIKHLKSAPHRRYVAKRMDKLSAE